MIGCHSYIDTTTAGLTPQEKMLVFRLVVPKNMHTVSASSWQVVVPGDAKGGRLVRWGGLHGRLCLADGDLALEEHQQFGYFKHMCDWYCCNWMLLECKLTNHEGHQGCYLIDVFLFFPTIVAHYEIISCNSGDCDLFF